MTHTKSYDSNSILHTFLGRLLLMAIQMPKQARLSFGRNTFLELVDVDQFVGESLLSNLRNAGLINRKIQYQSDSEVSI
jgi:hypothetical protein